MSKEGDIIFSAITEAEARRRNERLVAEKIVLEELTSKSCVENEIIRRQAEILKKSGIVEIFYEIRDRGIKKLKETPLTKKGLLGFEIIVKNYTPANVFLSDKKDMVTLIFDEWNVSYSGYSGSGYSEISAFSKVGEGDSLFIQGKDRHAINDKTTISNAIIMALENPNKIRREFERE